MDADADADAAQFAPAQTDGRFRLALDFAAIGMCLIAPTGEFLKVNSALGELLGRPPEELTHCTWQELTHPDDLDSDLALVGDVLEGRRDAYRLVKRFLRPDGTVVWGDLSVSCVRGSDGAVQYFIAQIIDVTEQERTVVELRESRELFDALLEASAVGMSITSPDGRLLRVNAALADLLGRTIAELESIGWREVTAHDDVAAEGALLASVVAGEQDSYRLLKRIDRPDGSGIWGELTVSAVRGVDGSLRFLVGQIVDVTDRETAHRALESTLATMIDPHAVFGAVCGAGGELVDLRYQLLNDAAVAYLQRPADQLIGRRLAEVFPGEASATILEWCRPVLAEGVHLILDDVTMVSAIDNASRWFDVRAVRVGESVSFTWRDVTERHRVAMELAEREANFRLLSDNMSDVVVRSGPDQAISWVSPSVTSILGWRPQDLVGRRLLEFMHPEDRPQVLDQQRSSLADGGTGGRATLRIATSSGGWRWMSDHGQAILDAGSVIGGIDALRDVEAEHRVSEALAERERELRGVIDTLIDPWILLAAVRDESGRIVDFEYVDANEAACVANQIDRDRLLGSRLMALFPAHGPSGLLEAYARVVETGEQLTLDDEPFVDEFDGRERRFDNRAVRVGDGISFTWRDVTDRYEARRVLREQANQDLLTGLANRRQLERKMAEIFSRAPRTGTAIAVLYCDVDLFKEINDTLGHSVGDQVLAGIGAAIRGVVREADVVARVGGDEFVVVLDGIASPDAAQAVAQKIVRAVHRPMVAGGTSVEPRLSIGVAVTQYGRDPQDALSRADAALYRAKRAGRNRVEVDDTSERF